MKSNFNMHKACLKSPIDLFQQKFLMNPSLTRIGENFLSPRNVKINKESCINLAYLECSYHWLAKFVRKLLLKEEKFNNGVREKKNRGREANLLILRSP